MNYTIKYDKKNIININILTLYLPHFVASQFTCRDFGYTCVVKVNQ